MNIELTSKEKDFVMYYFGALEFTETGDEDQPLQGAELDETFERESIIDCLAFYNLVSCYISDDQLEQAAYDFWFTRNEHGVGFLDTDRGWNEFQSQNFTKLAESFGQVYPVFEDWYEQ